MKNEINKPRLYLEYSCTGRNLYWK